MLALFVLIGAVVAYFVYKYVVCDFFSPPSPPPSALPPASFVDGAEEEEEEEEDFEEEETEAAVDVGKEEGEREEQTRDPLFQKLNMKHHSVTVVE